MIKYQLMVLGDLETNCYLLWSEETKKCLIIDPADSGAEISEEIQMLRLEPLGILLTHGHFDHVMGALDLKLIYNLPVYASSKDNFLLKETAKSAGFWLKKKIKVPDLKNCDVDLEKVDAITLDEDSRIEVIRTPGHTPGSCCFYCQKEGFLFSGDTLFDGSVGSTEHKYSSRSDLKVSIKKLIKELPEEIQILPGHGSSTTIREAARLVI